MAGTGLHRFKRFLAVGIVSWLFLSLAGLAYVRADGPLPTGTAAGDVTSDGAVLWARGAASGPLTFEYATDPGLAVGVETTVATVTDPARPVKVELTGLSPATAYYYRATDAANNSATGRFRTPAVAGTYRGLRFGVSGDWEEELAPYPSISNADEQELDFFVELGDTIVAGDAATLAEFLARHSGVYTTHLGLNTWADLRAATAILATIDDNDVRDNFAGGADPATDSRFDNTGDYINETTLYGTALQAFQAYNPLRNEFYGATGDDRTAGKRRLFRNRTHGRDAAIFLLDSRSFRDQQLPVPTTAAEALTFLNDSFNLTGRTLLGGQQLADLKIGLQQAQDNGVTWKVVFTPSPIQNLGLIKAEDRFEGYAAERTNLLKFIKENSIQNVVFVAAGMHGTVVNDLNYQESPFGPQYPTGAFEIIVGPVAIDPPSGPLGPATIPVAYANGIVSEAEYNSYQDPSRTRQEKDLFVEEVLNEMISIPNSPVDYDPIGLEPNEDIDATLLQGSYLLGHSYSWTQFEIEPASQVLTVTTYGVDYYTQSELDSDPDDIINRTPAVVGRFVVNPQLETGSIGDYVWHDANNDRLQDGTETGLAGVTVYLDSNANDRRDAGEPAAATATGGSYSLPHLAAGSYRVKVDSSTIPAGYTLTTGNDPLLVTLSAGEAYAAADFGYYQAPNLSPDFVYLPLVIKSAD